MSRIIISESKPLTAEQLKEVEEAKKQPVTFDEDCQELSPAMIKAFKRATANRSRRMKYA